MKAVKTLVLLGSIALSTQQNVLVSCGTAATKGNCAERTIDEKAKTISILLDASTCDYTKEYCDIDSLITSESAKCTKGTFTVKPSNYPGEACTKDEECSGLEAKCVDKICKRATDPEKCPTGHADCSVGKYCKDNACVNQLDTDGKCSSTFECKNELLCLDGVCKPFYTGENKKTYKVSTDAEKAYVCAGKYPIFDAPLSVKCATYELRAGNKKDGAKVDSLECTKNEECTGFVDDDTTTALVCTPSVSTDGKHYCQEMRKILI